MIMESKYPERYTIVVNKSIVDTWEKDVPDFTILNQADIWYDDSLVCLEITPKVKDGGYTVEDVFDLTDALMAHEEYTSGFFTDESSIEKLADSYSWDGSAWTLIGDMLTEGEKIHILLMQFDLITGEKPLIKDLEYSTSLQKDPERIYKPIIGNVKDLFGDVATWFRFKPKDGAPAEINGWWANIVPDCGLFVIILDYDKEEEYDYSEQLSLLEEDPEYEEAMDLYRKEMEEEDYWNGYLDDDDYAYLDKWYDKKGIF